MGRDIMNTLGHSLRRLLGRLGAGQTPPTGPIPVPPWPNPPEINDLIATVRPFTVCDPQRLTVLYGLAKEVVREVEGDFVECGVFNGGSAAVLSRAIWEDPTRKIWLFDTFEGMPDPGPHDGDLAPQYAGKVRGALETVQQALQSQRFPLERVVFRKGLFADTFQDALPEKVALIHVDADWYESVHLSLETFYDRVQEGGVILLDDFGHWEGAREAFYAFCEARKLRPLLERVGYTQAFWRKGEIHNRSRIERYVLGIYRPGE